MTETGPDGYIDTFRLRRVKPRFYCRLYILRMIRPLRFIRSPLIGSSRRAECLFMVNELTVLFWRNLERGWDQDLALLHKTVVASTS